MWRAFESQETASTTRSTADGSPSASAETAETSVSPTFPPEFIARCLQRLNDELAMELFLPLADAAAEDGALVTATVDHRNTREAVFAWRAEKRTDTDAQSGENGDSETAAALALRARRRARFRRRTRAPGRSASFRQRRARIHLGSRRGGDAKPVVR